jgi:hypothetical protein
MAIFGAGSNWDGDEMKEDFFKDSNFVVGWDYSSSNDLYDAVCSLKAGDIIYLKSNWAGSRSIRVKGIGVITRSFIHSFIENKLASTDVTGWNELSIPVEWIVKEEFRINIPPGEGKLSNVRSATIFEEHLPLVQTAILSKLYKININSKRENEMNYDQGQFVAGVLSVGLQILQMWQSTRDVTKIKELKSQFNEVASSQGIRKEGARMQSLIPAHVFTTLEKRVSICWNDFNDVADNPNITPRQMDRYTQGLRECLCSELKRIKLLNGELPTELMNQWWTQYACAGS